MSATLLALVSFGILLVVCVLWAAEIGDRRFLLQLMLCGWLLLGSLLIIVNSWAAFAGGGDDEVYYALATQVVRASSDLLNPQIFRNDMEQIGYPWLLGAVNLIFAPGLLGLKFFNLLLFLLIVLVWYRIGCSLSDTSLGRWMAVGTMLLTPLWFYAFFLLKDLLIVLIQSMFLLGLVRVWRSNSIWAWLLVGISAFATVPLRSPLVVQNVAVVTGVGIVRLLGRGQPLRRLVGFAIGLLVMAALWSLAGNPTWLQSLGVYSDGRVVGSDAMMDMGAHHAEVSRLNRPLFPLIYLFGETSGLSVESWRTRDAYWLRGVLALPWIALLPPFFFLGLRWLASPAPNRSANLGFWRSFVVSRLLVTPWAAMIMFIATSMGVSWVVGDTTRWRLADMPAIGALSVAAWRSGSRHVNRTYLILWLLMVGSALSGYYLIKSS